MRMESQYTTILMSKTINFAVQEGAMRVFTVSGHGRGQSWNCAGLNFFSLKKTSWYSPEKSRKNMSVTAAVILILYDTGILLSMVRLILFSVKKHSVVKFWIK